WGRIDGVIHAAALLQAEPVASITRDHLAALLTPKIQGGLVLDRLFAGEELDFIVFCSSLSSVIGETGQAASAAANAFLESLARRNFFRSRCFMIAINWDAWEDPISAASSADKSTSTGIRPAEAVDLLRRLLRARPGPQA